MDRDDFLVSLTTLQTGYLALETALARLEERLKKLEESERSWAVWYAKLAAVPVVLSFCLTVVSVAAMLDQRAGSAKIGEAIARLEKVLPRAH